MMTFEEYCAENGLTVLTDDQVRTVCGEIHRHGMAHADAIAIDTSHTGTLAVKGGNLDCYGGLGTDCDTLDIRTRAFIAWRFKRSDDCNLTRVLDLCVDAMAEPKRLPRYTEDEIAEIVRLALAAAATYQPLGFALPVAKPYGACVAATDRDPDDLTAWVRFDLIPKLGFNLTVRRKKGEWSVTASPVITLGDLKPLEAGEFATAFATAARVCRDVAAHLTEDGKATA